MHLKKIETFVILHPYIFAHIFAIIFIINNYTFQDNFSNSFAVHINQLSFLFKKKI